MPALEATTDLLRVLGEPSRLRLLALLGHDELTVAELTSITQLAQSRVSTHLARLRDAGLVRDRREGTQSYWARVDKLPSEADRLWTAMIETTRDPVLEQDRSRARRVVEARDGGEKWADAVAGQMERHYSPGRTWEAATRGLLGLCRAGDVLDVGSGDGVLAALVAPRARSVTCLDRSAKVIDAARRRLAKMQNVRFVVGDMHALPFEDRAFDAVMLMNCLTYATSPDTVLAEAARVLRPGGAVSGVTLREHAHADAVAAYGHENLGFRPRALGRALERAGLVVDRSEVTSRESRPPYFEILTFHAEKRPS
jgi:ArsR family transcriptional regulator